MMLGLLLVVGIMALLLGGTLIGVGAYIATVKTVDCKLAEYRKASDLKEAVKRLTEHAPDGLRDVLEQQQSFEPKIADVRHALDDYQLQLQYTLLHHRDPDGGFQESGYVTALKDGLQKLEKALAEYNAQPQASTVGDAQARSDRGKVEATIGELLGATDDLLGAIYEHLDGRTKASKRYYNTSLIIVFSTSIAGVLLMGVLLRLFYTRVLHPIRDLEAGAGRVAQGDLDHRIEIHSGDEMEELANAFNNMTDRLCEIYRDLNRQVNERSRQLVRSERLASVGFLAAGVAHEINNPLQAITLYSGALEARLAELVRRLQQPGVPESATVPADEQEVLTKYLKTILEEAFRCKRITERLLEFSRGGERHRELIDMTELVQAVLDVAQPLQSCKGKEINFEPAGQVTGWANADEIKSVVLNLVVNALDSMEEGGRLTIRLRPNGGMAELVLTDTGCGMTAEVLENIFEPFFTRSRTGKGTGLGLTISHRIITQHGGEIEAASPGPDQGSTFTVRLPRQPAEDVASSGREDEAEAEEPVIRRLAA
jgi:signal transduction histidine kinase